MKWKQFGWIVLLVATWLLPSWGASAPKKLSLDDAVRGALMNNPKIKAAEAKLDEAKALIVGSRLWSNPGIETELTRGEGNHLSLKFSKEIAGGGKHKRRAAKIELQKSQMAFENVKRELTAEVKSAFFSVLYGQERMSLAEGDLQTAKQQEDIAQVRFNIGDVPETELNSARLRVKTAEEEKESIGRELRLAQNSLNTLLGRPAETELIAEGKLNPLELNLDVERRIDNFVSNPLKLIKSVEQHPSIKAMKLERDRILEELSLAKAKRLPSPTFSLLYERDVRENLFGGGVGFPLPLFDRNQGEIKDAVATEKVKSSEIEGQKLDITKKLWDALTSLRSAERTIELTKSAIAIAEGNLKSVKRSYELGEEGLTDVIDAQDKLLLLKKTYLKASFDYNEAFIAIERWD